MVHSEQANGLEVSHEEKLIPVAVEGDKVEAEPMIPEKADESDSDVVMCQDA